MEEKKRLELKIQELEEELEEEQGSNEVSAEKAARATAERERMAMELNTERVNVQRLESALGQAGRELKDLKLRLEESEAQGKGKFRSQIAALEANIQNLEANLEAEVREKQAMLKANRKLDMRIKTLQSQVSEEVGDR